MTDDPLSRQLSTLTGEAPVARTGLTEAAKDELVARIGPRTARDIVRAARELPRQRIPFLFSTVDTQAVVDLLANDVDAAIARALAAKAGAKGKAKAKG